MQHHTIREAIDGLPARARQALYIVIALAGLALTTVQAVTLAIGLEVPVWLVGAWAGYGVIAPAAGVIATGHLVGAPVEARRAIDPDGEYEPDPVIDAGDDEPVA